MSLRSFPAVALVVLGLAQATPAAAADLDGAAVYRHNCVACHGPKADGKGPAAAALRPAPTDFTQASWWEGRSDAQVAESIRTGKPGTSMMSYTSLTDDELAAMVAWLRTQAAE